jgi:cell division protein FtsB
MKIVLPRRVNTIMLAVFIGALVYILVLGNNSLLSRLRLQQRIKTAIADIKDLQKQNKVLDNEIQRLKNDDLYLQNTARKQGFLRPNETVYRFIQESPATNVMKRTNLFQKAWAYRTGRLVYLLGLLGILIFVYILMVIRQRKDKRKGIDKQGK